MDIPFWFIKGLLIRKSKIRKISSFKNCNCFSINI